MTVPALAPGDVFAGKYRISRVLREGIPTFLDAAEQIATGETRLLQRVPPTDRSPILFGKEAQVWARLAGEHGTALIEDGVEGDTPWLAWELPEGETLAERVRRAGPLPHDEARAVIVGLGEALAKTHAEGMIQRELRPDVVFVGPRVRLSGHLVADCIIRGATDAALGSADDVWGWAAPEQITGASHQWSASTDVWAFALIAFWSLTGRLFWKAEIPPALAREILIDPVPPASERAAELGVPSALPPGFDAWFAACTDRDPAARLDMAAATRALAALFAPPSSEPILANPKGSFYDDGLLFGSPPPSQPGGYRGGSFGRVEQRREQVILANPKGSYYDRGLARNPRRWPVVIAIVLFLAAPAILLLRACQR